MHNVQFTERALKEIELMVQNDFTLKDKHFRISISGKGCDGFDYSAGFTNRDPKDTILEISGESQKLLVLLDPFASYYLKDVSIDFIQDFENDDEGFYIQNNNQEEYSGKFWKDSPEKVPTL